MKNPQSTFRAIRYYFPLAPAGSVLFALAVLLLANSFLTRDPYQIVLAVTALFVLAVLAFLSRVQADQLAKHPIQWDSSEPLVAGPQPSFQRLTGIVVRPFLGFRLHFAVRGWLTVGRSATLFLSQETVASSASRSGELPLRLLFPLSGLFHAHGALKVGDIFGLTRAQFGDTYERHLAVIPAAFPEAISVRVEATERSEEKQSQINSDEEKYYMREYAPGDRFRDINWKSSSRLSQLFTRIAPIAQEQTKLISVELRNYREDAPESLESIMHLNHLKSWLLTFLRVVKESNPDFQFLVITAGGATRLTSRDDIERYAEELAELTYHSESVEETAAPATDEIYLFTTPYDRQLPGLLASYPQKRINLFRTVSPRAPGTRTRRTVALFHFREQLPIPGLWVFRRDFALEQPGLDHSRARVLGEEAVEARLVTLA